MIFVSVGTHPQPFNRLLESVDDWIEREKVEERVFAQTGYSSYKPARYASAPFLSIPEFNQRVKECRLFITHGGEGNIGTALQFRKPMVLVPRLKKYGEHTNDHQSELVEAIASQGKAVACDDARQLGDCIRKAEKLDLKRAVRGNVLEILEAFLVEQEKRLA